MLVTRPREAVQRLVAAAIRGVEDVAPAVLLFMGIGMLLVATQQPQFAAALRPLVAGGWLRNPVAYVLLFGVASPLVLYRGPLNPFGVGIAIFTVLLTAHVLPPVVLVAAIMAVVQVQNVCDPTNTANVWVANFTGVPIDTITKRTLPYQTAVAIAATLAVVLAAPALFGERPFARSSRRARADEDAAGILRAASARDRIAVDDDGTRAGTSCRRCGCRRRSRRDLADVAPARGSERRAIARTSATPRTFSSTASTFALIEGDDLDVGLRLEDCGGWIVDEWHDHESLQPPPPRAEARALALQGVARLRAWARCGAGSQRESLRAEASRARPGDRADVFLRASSPAPTAICGPTFAPVARPTPQACAPAT